MHSTARIVFLTLFLTLSLCSCRGSGSKDLAPGLPVTSYPVQTLDGATVELRDLFGKITVVSFMASWCESCKSEFAELNQLHSKLIPNGGLVLGVALDDTLDALKLTKQNYNLSFPIVFDTKARARKFFKLTGFPETVVLDSAGAPKLLQDVDGNLTIKFIGPRPWEKLTEQILAIG